MAKGVSKFVRVYMYSLSNREKRGWLSQSKAIN